MDKKQYKFNKILLVFFIILIPVVVLLVRDLDNDTWFMLNHGRYILKNGLYPEYEPFTVHQGMSFTFQKWLCCILFWLLYDWFGKIGVKIVCIIVYLAFDYVLLKLLNYIKKEAELQNLFIIAVLNGCMTQYLYTRPQLFTYLFLAAELLVLEKYIREKKAKLLIWIPVMSMLEIQIHSTIWPIMLIFMLPYMFDISCINKFTDVFKFIPRAEYKRYPIWLTFVASVAVAVINPYGTESLVYLYNSLKVKELSLLITEVRPPAVKSENMIIMVFILVLFVVGMIKKKKIELRYLFLIGGTTLMSFMSKRQMSFMLIAAALVFAYIFTVVDTNKLRNILICVFLSFLTGVSVYDAYIDETYYQQPMINAINALDEYEKKNNVGKNVFNLDDEGSYLEFLGYRAYSDTRAEVFSDKINHSENYIGEKIKFLTGEVSYKEFLHQYDYDYIIIKNRAPQYDFVKKDSGLKSIYKNERFTVFRVMKKY